MSETKWTPGPWPLVQHGESDSRVGANTLIAIVYSANRDMRQTMYVHRSCQPLTQIDFHPRVNTKELQLGIGFDYECEGVCGL